MTPTHFQYLFHTYKFKPNSSCSIGFVKDYQ